MIRASARRRRAPAPAPASASASAFPVGAGRFYGSRAAAPGFPGHRRASSWLRRLGLAGGLIGLGAASWAALGDDPRRRAKLLVAVPLRLARNVAVASVMIAGQVGCLLACFFLCPFVSVCVGTGE